MAEVIIKGITELRGCYIAEIKDNRIMYLYKRNGLLQVDIQDRKKDLPLIRSQFMQGEKADAIKEVFEAKVHELLSYLNANENDFFEEEET